MQQPFSSSWTSSLLRRFFVVTTILTPINLESVLEENARANPDARIHPLTHVSVDRAYQAESVGSLKSLCVFYIIIIHTTSIPYTV